MGRVYAMVAVAAVIVGMYAKLMFAISGLEDEVEKLKLKGKSDESTIATMKAERVGLLGSIDMQNAEIEKVAVQYVDALSKYNKEKNRPARIVEVEKEKIKFIKGECDDGKKLMDDIRAWDAGRM